MNIVTTIMRQHRRMQWLLDAIDRNQRLRATLMVELIDEVMLHVACMDAVMVAVTDTSLVRVHRSHAAHHDRARLALFRIATSAESRFDDELSRLRAIVGEHARDEMLVVRQLCRLSEEQLEVLGVQMAQVAPPPPSGVMKEERPAACLSLDEWLGRAC